MSENRSEWALGYARRKLSFHSRENEVSSERNRRASCGMDGAAFPRSFFPLDLTRNFLDLAFRFPEGGEEKAFAPCLMREEAVNRMFKPEAPVICLLLGRDRQCLGSQLLYYIMYVLLILFRIIGTCTVDQDTSGFKAFQISWMMRRPREAQSRTLSTLHSPVLSVSFRNMPSPEQGTSVTITSNR